MKYSDVKQVNIIGAGLVGSLHALMTAKRMPNIPIQLFERRENPLTAMKQEGRSINLAISIRGISALAEVGLDKKVLENSVPMRGRVIHLPNAEPSFQPYSPNSDKECIYSISRSGLNQIVLAEALKQSNVSVCFEHRLAGVSKAGSDHITETSMGELVYQFETPTGLKTVRPNSNTITFGTDGSASVFREFLKTDRNIKCSEQMLNYGYKEFAILPNKGNSKSLFKLEENALHIWPRKTFMLIALPNQDGSFTCTLFLPFDRNPNCISFSELETPEQVDSFLRNSFDNAYDLMDQPVETFFKNPTGRMTTVKLDSWSYDDRFFLMGDAAHAIVPFFGQGMNCGFEDVSAFQRIAKDGCVDPLFSVNDLFRRCETDRKVNADAIADLAVENFTEMRDRVSDPVFQKRVKLEHDLEKAFPDRFRSRYGSVSFTKMPYSIAKSRGECSISILEKTVNENGDLSKVDLSEVMNQIEMAWGKQ